MFEPQFAFLDPLEEKYVTVAARALAVPLPFLAGLVFSRHWSPYSGAAWAASSFILGPALAFFELTSGGWSAGRLAYDPALLLSLALALVKPGHERAATRIRRGVAICALAAALLTFERALH